MNKGICFFLCAMILLLAGCERRPLVDRDDNVTLKVTVNVKNVLNVTAGIYNENIPLPDIPVGMFRVLLYDTYTKERVGETFISNKSTDNEGNTVVSGRIKLNPGTYDIVCYSFDTPSTLVRGTESRNSITAYTSEISEHLYSRFNSRAVSDPRIYYQPDHLVVAHKEAYTIEEKANDITIECDGYTLTDTYYVQIRLVNGEYASNATAVLSGLSKENRIGFDEPGTEPAATYFEMQKSVDVRLRTANQNVLCALFNTFGKIPGEHSDLKVTFNVITTRGDIQELEVDMDEVFETEDARLRHWLLIDKEFVIEPPKATGGGGFQPTVDDWDGRHGVIEL